MWVSPPPLPEPSCPQEARPFTTEALTHRNLIEGPGAAAPSRALTSQRQARRWWLGGGRLGQAGWKGAFFDG